MLVHLLEYYYSSIVKAIIYNLVTQEGTRVCKTKKKLNDKN